MQTSLREITVMIKDLNQTIINEINKIQSVYEVDTSHTNRITVNVDQLMKRHLMMLFRLL